MAAQVPGARLKVLYLIDGLLIGGAEKSLLEIIRRFRVTEAIVCTLYRSVPLRPAYEAAGLRVIGLDLPERYHFADGVWRVRELVRRERPALLHATLFRAGIVARLASIGTGIPLVDSFVNESYSPMRGRWLGPVQRLKWQGIRWIDRLTAPRVNAFIANSQTVALANARALRVPMERIRVIPRGRNPLDFPRRPAADLQRQRQALGLSEDDWCLLCVGRFWPVKRQADILRALPLILAAVPKTRLLLAGDGPERGALVKLAGRLGVAERVAFLGFRHDIPDILALAEVVISASEYEGLPGAVVESMLAERPLVLSRIPIHAEMIREEETGLFFNLYDPTDLARQVLRLRAEPDLGPRLARAAAVVARECYDVARVAARYEAIYRELCDG